jgi:hypothetical protein
MGRTPYSAFLASTITNCGGVILDVANADVRAIPGRAFLGARDPAPTGNQTPLLGLPGVHYY